MDSDHGFSAIARCAKCTACSHQMHIKTYFLLLTRREKITAREKAYSKIVDGRCAACFHFFSGPK